MTLVFLDEALEEMLGTAMYYEGRVTGLGALFLAAVEQTTRRVLVHPQAGPVVRGSVRKRFVAGFPFKLLYSIEGEAILIVAVMHQSRRPGYWRKRLST